MISIGDNVAKISKKPFKSGNQIEKVVGLATNTADPKKRNCAVFSDGSVCNLDMLKKSNTMIEKCRCGSEPASLHTCPYQEEINGDSEALCGCCSKCIQQCLMDI